MKKGGVMVTKKSPSKRRAHKRGDDVNEMAILRRKVGRGFKQSRDIREDRGLRQNKLGGGLKHPRYGRG